MKPREFYKIMADFVKEDKRWRALEVGDTVYDEQPRGFENDYHEAIIKEINIDEREIVVKDISVDPPVERTYSHFLTVDEFNKL